MGADVIMTLDVCPPADATAEEVEKAVDTTGRWAVRCAEAASKPDQMLFGIVQGGLFPDLRERSAGFLTSLDFPGYAIGGVSVGESKEQLYEISAATSALLPASKPRYLMGVGSPEDLVQAVAAGIDMFDCALPTRIARNGALFTRKGRANVYSAPFKDQKGPVDEDCDCYSCRTFSAAYFHHLFRAEGAPRLPACQHPQPQVRLAADGRDAGRHRRRQLPDVQREL